jgi:hypothetical protein
LEGLRKELTKTGASVLSMRIVNAGSSGDGVYLVATYAVEHPTNTGAWTKDSGTVADFLKRQADGAGKFHVNIWNSENSLPGA